MDQNQPRTAGYGTWPSPLSAAMVANAGFTFGHVAIDDDTVYWRESRPDKAVLGTIVTSQDGTCTDVTPPDVNALSLVYENGGGEFTVQDGVVYYTSFDDQRVYRRSPTGGEAITPAPHTQQGLRYADLTLSNDGRVLYCVREDHDAVASGDAAEPQASLVRIPTDGTSQPTVVASGNDFYAAPRLSPRGDRLAYLAWDHPQMPWDGTHLHVADVTPNGDLTNDQLIMGGPEESVLQPAWHPDGTLHAVSDRTGWWNLYRRDDASWTPYRAERAEHTVPPWLLGVSTYAFLDDGRTAVIAIRDGEQTLDLLTPAGDHETDVLPYSAFGGKYCLPVLRSDGDALYVVAGGPTTPDQLIQWRPGTEPEILRTGPNIAIDSEYLSIPDHVTVPTRDGAQTHAFVYEPSNPDVTPPDDARPPLLIRAPGGPTLGTHPAYTPSIQYYTSRGFVVADVNYRGSTGYGRPYREALNGEWGIVDVADCLDVATQLADEGVVDPDRIAIRGLSAGGFIALAALAFHEGVAAGVSQAGIADLDAWAATTHKFESRYAERLIGPYPESAAVYRDRSPLHQAEDIDAPVLLLHGTDDSIVPRAQAEQMAETLDANGVPHELLVFEAEGHLFYRPETIARAHEAELAFYTHVFESRPTAEPSGLDLASTRNTPESDKEV